MSRFGDILIEHGPITQDYVASPGLSSDMRWIRAAELNALRDELFELRQLRAAAERLGECARQLDPSELRTVLRAEGCGWCGGDHLAELVRRADQHTQDCR